MKKAVAVPYIIALILGVAVIGLVGYWFATTGGKFGGQSSKTACDSKFAQWCISNPSGKYADFKIGTECVGVDGSYSECKEIIGFGSGATPTPTPSPTPSPTPAPPVGVCATPDFTVEDCSIGDDNCLGGSCTFNGHDCRCV